jgi:hypothetical protein
MARETSHAMLDWEFAACATGTVLEMCGEQMSEALENEAAAWLEMVRICVSGRGHSARKGAPAPGPGGILKPWRGVRCSRVGGSLAGQQVQDVPLSTKLRQMRGHHAL